VIVLPAAPPLTGRTDRNTSRPPPPRLLAAIAIEHADAADFDLVDEPLNGERTFTRVVHNDTHDVWLIRWGVGARTALHDHGGSAGALYVVRGELVERRPNPAGSDRPLRRVLRAGNDRPMAPTHVHEVANESSAPAASVHVYSPPLTTMHHFELGGDADLRVARREVIEAAQRSSWNTSVGPSNPGSW